MAKSIQFSDIPEMLENAEHDPYGFAMPIIRTCLEWALDDGISGQMNQREFEILDALAKTIGSLDPTSAPEPRVA